MRPRFIVPGYNNTIMKEAVMTDYKNLFNLKGKRAVVIGGGGGIGGAIAESYAALGVKTAIVGRSA